MNDHFTKILFDAFPNLYKGKDQPITENLMPFGFDHGDGWFLIIWNLSEKLEPMGVKAVQVKEKYGTLRFYLEGYTDEADKAIRIAEQESRVTCEITGRPGKLRCIHGWYSVMSDEELQKSGKKEDIEDEESE